MPDRTTPVSTPDGGEGGRGYAVAVGANSPRATPPFTTDSDPRATLLAPTEGFDPLRVSPSRVNKLTECGVAFRRHYIDGEPPQRRGSFALNGSVVHRALENWAPDRTQDLLALMRDAWLVETQDGPVVRDFLAEYQKINVAVLVAEQEAREAYERKNNKPSQAPRMTRHFKESSAARALFSLLREWGPRLSEESPWEFSDRDPLAQFYDDSLVLAKRYQAQYGHLKPALYTEFEVTEPWRGFTLVGYVDAVELLLDPDTFEIQGVGVLDYKTYKREPAEHKDYRQLVMYDAAIRALVERGALQLPVSLDDVPLYVGVDYVRYAGVKCDWLEPEGNSRRWWRITEEDHDRVERELNAYRATVEQGNFLPAAKGTNPDFCDYGASCCLRSTGSAGGCAERVEVKL